MKPKKVPYNILCIEMEKLFLRQFDPSDILGMEEHCELMISLIEASGWTVNDYVLRMFEHSPQKGSSMFHYLMSIVVGFSVVNNDVVFTNKYDPMNDLPECSQNLNPQNRLPFPTVFSGFRFGSSIEEVRRTCRVGTVPIDPGFDGTKRMICDRVIGNQFKYNHQSTVLDFCDNKLCGIIVQAIPNAEDNWATKFVDNIWGITKSYGEMSCTETDENIYEWNWKAPKGLVGGRIVATKTFPLTFQVLSPTLVKLIDEVK